MILTFESVLKMVQCDYLNEMPGFTSHYFDMVLSPFFFRILQNKMKFGSFVLF